MRITAFLRPMLAFRMAEVRSYKNKGRPAAV